MIERLRERERQTDRKKSIALNGSNRMEILPKLFMNDYCIDTKPEKFDHILKSSLPIPFFSNTE